jgi:hypothetical protein
MRGSIARVAVAGVASASLLSCAGPTLVGDWANPEYGGQAYPRVFVVGVSQDGVLRRAFEGRLAARLAELGVEAVPSHELVTADGKVPEEELWRAVQASGAPAVLVTRLARVDRGSGGNPDYLSSAAMPAFGRAGLYAYYSEARALSPRASADPDRRIYPLENTLWDVRRDELVWSGSTQSLAAEEAGEGLDPLVALIVQGLRSRGLI